MKASTKKWVLAGGTAFMTAAGEVFMHLASGGTVNWTTAMMYGTVMGVFVRGAGAALAAIATSETESEE